MHLISFMCEQLFNRVIKSSLIDPRHELNSIILRLVHNNKSGAEFQITICKMSKNVMRTFN